MRTSIMEMIQHLFPTVYKRGRRGLFLQSSPTAPAADSFPPSFLKELAARFSGKLLLRSEIDLDEQLFQQLLHARYFVSHPALKMTIVGPICQRCNNKQPVLFGKIPCHRCQKVHYYCRNCIKMGRITDCEKLYSWSYPIMWRHWKQPCSWDGTLTLQQEKASERIIHTIKNRKELLVWAVTGSGKTEMLFPGIDFALKKGMRICIASPRTDVVRELLPRMKQAFEFVPIEALYGGSKDKTAEAQFILSTTHQLLRFKEAFDVLIIDEIDAFPYHNDPSLQFAANRAVKRNGARIYLTATPRKNLRILMFLNRLPFVFVAERYHGQPLPVPQFIRCRLLQLDNKKVKIPEELYTWVETKKQRNRQVLLLVATIQAAEHLAEKLKKELVSRMIIAHENEIAFSHSEDDKRVEKIEQFRNRIINILVTTTILERGVTFPAIDVAVIGADHDVFDEAALVQIAGRVGRSKYAPTGDVYFFYRIKTLAMVRAKEDIIAMNKRAKKE